MTDYTVEVKGPGGNVNFPRAVIEKALREAGFVVSVENSYPEELSLDKEVEWAKRANEEHGAQSIKIKVVHYPWGG